jgi:hypothetical protein
LVKAAAPPEKASIMPIFMGFSAAQAGRAKTTVTANTAKFNKKTRLHPTMTILPT